MLGEAHGVSAGHRSDDAVTLPAASGDEGVLPSTSVPTVEAAWGGKRFRKRGTRGPGAMVRVRMETVVTGRDGRREEEGAEEEGVEENVQNADEAFEEVMQQGRANSRRRR